MRILDICITYLLLLLLSHFSHVQLCVTPEMAAHQAPHPPDSPGKNTAVGCHFLLQCMKVKSESEVAQSCLTPSDPMDCSPPASSIHGILQARLEWVAIPCFRGYSGPRDGSWVSCITSEFFIIYSLSIVFISFIP